jgi:cytosine/adenosine deaminase-related metal-dependent hydrolase
MDLGQSQGGCRPTPVVESLDAILGRLADAGRAVPRPVAPAMVRVGLAPCSPFSVTGRPVARVGALARSLGVRLHTHLAETLDEEDVLPQPPTAAPRWST